MVRRLGWKPEAALEAEIIFAREGKQEVAVAHVRWPANLFDRQTLSIRRASGL